MQRLAVFGCGCGTQADIRLYVISHASTLHSQHCEYGNIRGAEPVLDAIGPAQWTFHMLARFALHSIFSS
jgi:hypothetical protein